MADPADIGSMGEAVMRPADGRDHFDLVCSSCGVVETIAASFMGCRVRALQEARRRGWTFPAHHRDRECPSCAIEKLLRGRGLYPVVGAPQRIAVQLEAAAAGGEALADELEGQPAEFGLGLELPATARPAVAQAIAAQAPAAFLDAEPAFPLGVRPAKRRKPAPQLDLFG